MLAMAAGFCAERGADPAACAGPILDGVHQDLLDALEFARRWTASGAAGDELPEPDEKIIDDALAARLGGDASEATRLALAWCSVEEWQPPALAVLCRSSGVRRRHAAAILPACRALEALERHDLKCLSYALAVLDDEPVIVLHRPTGTGFEVRIGGIGDNFQLHTLLAHVLVGGGHVAGTSPSAESVRLATDPEPTTGAPGPSRPEPSNSSPRTARASGTRGCPTTSLWWKDTACWCSTSRCTGAVGTPTGSSRICRVRPSSSVS